jgi:hypothetical protein
VELDKEKLLARDPKGFAGLNAPSACALAGTCSTASVWQGLHVRWITL